jgi:hypothetical protein
LTQCAKYRLLPCPNDQLWCRNGPLSYSLFESDMSAIGRGPEIEELDREYDEYRREHQSRFEQEFGPAAGSPASTASPRTFLTLATRRRKADATLGEMM